MKDHHPDPNDLSAFFDEQLNARGRARIRAHLADCPVCAAALARLGALHDEFQALPEQALGFDLGSVVEGRLAALPRAPRGTRPGKWLRWIPVGIGAAASLSFGMFMGASLTAGSASLATPAAPMMAVFDPVAPGGLCASHACYIEGRLP